MPDRKSSGSKKKSKGGETPVLRKSLLSIGVDKESVEKLLKSKDLEKVVVPVYWKDGLVSQASSIQLSKLPAFVKSFEKEFPDGQVRWDPDYFEVDQQENPSDVAIRIFFNYQEDDQGDHWSPKPTSLEEESYQRMLKRYSYQGSNPVQAHAVLHGG
jgi:hypothetical protein